MTPGGFPHRRFERGEYRRRKWKKSMERMDKEDRRGTEIREKRDMDLTSHLSGRVQTKKKFLLPVELPLFAFYGGRWHTVVLFLFIGNTTHQNRFYKLNPIATFYKRN